MGTPKKTIKKTVAPSKGAKKPTEEIDPKAKKKVVDDDEDDEFDLPIEELGGYETFDGYDEDDDY